MGNPRFGHLSFIQEAVDLADDQVDFSDTDIVSGQKIF